MKTIKHLSLAAAALAGMAFSSCNIGGDTYSGPTLEDQKQMISSLGAQKEGGFVYYNGNDENIKDVLDTIPSISVRFATNTTKDANGNVQSYYSVGYFQFPVKMLSNFISQEDLADAIAELDPVSLKANFIPYSVYTQAFVVNSYDIELGDIRTPEKEYKNVVIKFYNNQCLAGTETTNDQNKKSYWCFYMQPAYIYVNGQPTNYLQYYKFNNSTFEPIFKFTTDINKE